MFFLSRHSTLYVTVAQAKPWQRYACTLMMVAGMAYATFYIATYLAAFITQYEHEVRTLKQLVEQRTLATSQIKKLQDTLNDMQYTFRLKAAEGKKNPPIPFLLHQARSANVILTGCSQEQELSKDWYTKYLFTLDATGSFESIISFLEKLHESKKMVQFRSLHITHAESETCKLSCTLSMRQINMRNEFVRV